MGFLISQLLDGGMLHDDVMTVWGQGLGNYRQEPRLTGDGGVVWQPAARRSHDEKVLAPLAQPFSPNGGLKMLKGNLGRAVIKRSEEHTYELQSLMRKSYAVFCLNKTQKQKNKKQTIE